MNKIVSKVANSEIGILLKPAERDVFSLFNESESRKLPHSRTSTESEAEEREYLKDTLIPTFNNTKRNAKNNARRGDGETCTTNKTAKNRRQRRRRRRRRYKYQQKQQQQE